MSDLKIKIVKGENLAKIAKENRFDKLLLVGNGIKKDGVADSIFENTFEAFIGAVSIDTNINVARELVEKMLKQSLNSKPIKPYKTIIQELFKAEVKYKHISTNTDKKCAKLIFNNITYGVGYGSKIKEAEENAAKDALKKNINK